MGSQALRLSVGRCQTWCFRKGRWMFRRRAPLLLAFAAVTLVLALGASAGAATLSGGSANESFQAWFVQFKTPPAANGGSKAALAAERSAFFKNAADQGVSVSLRRSFDNLWNGVSVNVPKAQAGGLAGVPGVQAVYPVVAVSLPPATEGGGTSDPDLKYAITMTGADIAQNELHLDGHGVKVAIMDSGLDYTLPEFGSCSSIGGSCRVAGGFDFVGDSYDANPNDSTYQPVPHPDADPAPCDPNVADQRALAPGAGSSSAGHGTHVAGIVGADGRSDPDHLVTGVAPGATLYAYRVFGCNGSTDSDVMADAMERAAADHVNVLNMSIGAALVNFPNYPTAVAADNLAATGTTVVASIGNSGDTGLWSAGAPGVADNVIGVASADNIKTYLPYFTASPDGRHIHFNAAVAAPEPPTSGQLPLAQTGSPSTTNDACPTPPATVKDLGAGTYTGKAVLIRRGSCGFYNKSLAAQRAGASAVILYNNTTGRISPTVAPVAPDTETIHIPVVAINAADGAELSSRISAGPTTMTWTDQAEYVDNVDTPGRISSFSSWGTTSNLKLKPDITAPGGNIRSTWPHQQHGGHNVISGTSMSSPHVAGAAALYLQGHPGASPTAVREALQNSAQPFTNSVASSVLASTARQGAGLLNIALAAQQTTSVSPGKISLGDGSGGSQVLTIKNNSGVTKTYNLSFVATSSPIATALSGSNPPYTFFAFNNPGAAVTFSSPSVTLAPGETKQVTATIDASGVPIELTLYGGFIVLTNAAASTEKLRVPYLGLKGDYQTLPVITGGGCDLPTLARFGSASDQIECPAAANIQGLIAQRSGGVWEQPNRDPIVILYHFQHQSANYTFTLLDAATGQPVTVGGRIPVIESADLIPRNSAATSFFGSVWDGTLAFTSGNGKVQRKAAPGGVYKLKLTITKVKAFNDSRAAGTESWTSPAFTLRDG
jgi:minor extracellular serine protease Vpr